MPNRLRVGVLGLGRRWRRYRTALEHLRPQIDVRAVCDPLPGRAGAVAQKWQCDAAGSPTELLERDDVQALLILEVPWYGLWTLALAARHGKAAYCAASLLHDEARLDGLAARLAPAAVPLYCGLPPLATPALHRLVAEVAPGQLGTVFHFQAECSLSASLDAQEWLRAPAVLSLLHGARVFLGAAPSAVTAVAARGTTLATLLLEAPGTDPRGRAAVLTFWHDPRHGECRVLVRGERGAAEARLPGRLVWHTADGRHVWIATPGVSPERRLLEGFVQSLRGAPVLPRFDEVYATLKVWRAALRSLAEGGRPQTLG